MPLYQSIAFNSNTQILIWEITESYDQLLQEVSLNEKSALRLQGMKSEMHQRGFLSVRKLLQQAGLTDFDLYYDEMGKPHLHQQQHISITHSHQFAAIIISNVAVGIDIELQRPKISTIAHKFCDSEFQFLDSEKNEDYIRKLTVIWGAKEAIFKIQNEKGISFKNHIQVHSFELKSKQNSCKFHFEDSKKDFLIYFEEIQSRDRQQKNQNFTLVYAFENQPSFK